MTIADDSVPLVVEHKPIHDERLAAQDMQPTSVEQPCKALLLAGWPC